MVYLVLMVSNRYSCYDVLPSKRLLLEPNLRLGWKWLNYTGLHLDILMISVNQHRCCNATEYVFTSLVLVFALGVGVFEEVQLVSEVKKWKKWGKLSHFCHAYLEYSG